MSELVGTTFFGQGDVSAEGGLKELPTRTLGRVLTAVMEASSGGGGHKSPIFDRSGPWGIFCPEGKIFSSKMAYVPSPAKIWASRYI